MKSIVISWLSVLLYTSAYSQNDTLYKYWTIGLVPTTKDSAHSYTKIYKKEGSWYGEEYFSKGDKLKSKGNYEMDGGSRPVGLFDNYSDKGELDYTAEWANGKLLSKTYFYKNGQKKSYIKYDGNEIKEQKGWDEDGKEIRKFIVWRNATFKGGYEAWNKYLGKTAKAIVADGASAAGDHKIVVRFVVDEEGNVTNVRATSLSKYCDACAREAVNAIASSPKWKPAIFNNEPAKFYAQQPITIKVIEDLPKRR